ncbi:MAG: TetR/AcrR family transcriptional regulator [Pseudomonadota bacterium]
MGVQNTARTAQPAKRRRLKPDERVGEILEAAAGLVQGGSIKEISMDSVARRAGVSKGLLYAYFDNITSLLQAVLLAEYKDHERDQLAAIASADSFEAMARATAHINHERQNSRGVLVARLRGEPAIAGPLLAHEEKTRAGVRAFLVGEVTRHFDIPPEVAGTVAELVMGPAPGAVNRTAEEIDHMDAVWGAMMVGAMNELARRYGADGGHETDDTNN